MVGPRARDSGSSSPESPLRFGFTMERESGLGACTGHGAGDGEGC